MAGFEYKKSISGTSDVVRRVQMAASATIALKDALEFVDGKAKRVNAATDRPLMVCVGLPGVSATSVTSTATENREIEVISTENGAIFEVGFTPLVNGTACNSNSTATQLLVALTDGTSNDLAGGYVYVPELDEQRLIVSNTYSSNVVTIVVAEAFSTAPTTTHTARVVPFGPGTRALKLHGTNIHNDISVAIADITGGKVAVHDVNMKNKTAQIQFIA